MSVARWIAPPLVGALVSALVVAYLSSRQVAFFAGDDASNEFLPYLHEIGRMLARGELPLITTHSFSGGNLLIDFERAPFHPMTLASALMTLVASDVAVSVFFAWLGIFLALLGGYVLARQISLGALWASVVGWTIGLAPMFVLVYSAAWWNGVVGTVTLVWAVALLVRATKAPSWGNLVLLAFLTCMLLWSGWPHSLVAFAIIAVVTAIFVIADHDFVDEKRGRWVRIIRVGASIAVGAVIGLPQLSEYLVASSLLARTSEYTNAGNLGVPSWAQVLGAPFPMSFDFWDIWGGSVYWQIPIGFASVLVLIALCFVRWDARLIRDRWLRWSLALAAAFALLTQLPAQFGPLLYPFRFLPIGVVFVALACGVALARGAFVWNRTRVIVCAGIVVAATAAYTWRLGAPLTDERGQLIANILFAALVVAALLVLGIPTARSWVMVGLAVAGTVFTLVTTMPFAANYAVPTGLPLASEGEAPLPRASDGFVLQTDPELRLVNDVWPGRFSARYLLDGAAVFNGYDPAPRTALVALGGFRNQGTVPSDIIGFFAQTSDIGAECRFADYRIAWVVTSADPRAGRHGDLESCGFRESAVEGETAVFRNDVQPREGTLSTMSNGIEATEDRMESELAESVHVQNAGDAGVIHFARLWWPGYSASLDGQELEVSATDDLLVTVKVPAGADGTLELRYWPSSWRWALPLAGLALLSLVALALVTGILDRRRSREAGINRDAAPAP